MATEGLYDVDDGPLLRKRRMVMTMCTVQIVVSLALLANARRNLVLLVLNPFFVAAGALGYIGAKRCQPLLVMAHFLGSAGLSLLFGLFVLAEVRARSVSYRLPPTAHHYLLLLYQAFLKRSGTDLLYFAFNMPMDLLLLCSSGFSVSLWLSLNAYQAQSPSPSPNPSPKP